MPHFMTGDIAAAESGRTRCGGSTIETGRRGVRGRGDRVTSLQAPQSECQQQLPAALSAPWPFLVLQERVPLADR